MAWLLAFGFKTSRLMPCVRLSVWGAARQLSFQEESKQERFDTIDFREVEGEVEEVEVSKL